MNHPTNARRTLLWLIFSLTVITYLDRLCISAAMPAMAAEFGFSPEQKGWIFSAFTFAYAAFEIPSGWLAADKPHAISGLSAVGTHHGGTRWINGVRFAKKQKTRLALA